MALITQERLNGRYVPNITPRIFFAEYDISLRCPEIIRDISDKYTSPVGTQQLDTCLGNLSLPNRGTYTRAPDISPVSYRSFTVLSLTYFCKISRNQHRRVKAFAWCLTPAGLEPTLSPWKGGVLTSLTKEPDKWFLIIYKFFIIIRFSPYFDDIGTHTWTWTRDTGLIRPPL